MHSRPSMSPGDAKKSRAISLRDEAACTLGRRCCRAASPATTRSPARPLCGARRPEPVAVNVARHLARRQQEVPRDLLAGRSGLHLWPSISPGISPGNNKKSRVTSLRGEAACTLGRRCCRASRLATTISPARSPCGARRHALAAVDVARHLTRRQEEVPRDLLAGQGGMHSRPSMSPGISPGDDDKSRAISLRGEAACTLGRRCCPASRPSTTRSPARSPCGARRHALSAVNVARRLARRRR